MPYFVSMCYKHRLTVFGSGFICGAHQLDSQHHHYKQNKQEREEYEDQYFESVSTFLYLQKLWFMDIFWSCCPSQAPLPILLQNYYGSHTVALGIVPPQPPSPRPLTQIPYVTSVPARQLNAHSGGDVYS